MSTNLHALQQQMTEGLTRSMAKCQQLEHALKTAQDRNSMLEDRFKELRQFMREISTNRNDEVETPRLRSKVIKVVTDILGEPPNT
jgi:predicted  nucleic acid-binding Zn-ribbon protein